MRITDGQLNEAALATISDEAIQLLRSGEIAVLAERFGYALTFDREPELAIREESSDLLGRLDDHDEH
jgi:hypothetical protein